MPKYSEFAQCLERASVFSLRVVEGRMGKQYAKVFLHKLRKEGKITTLVNGWYTFRQTPYLLTVPLGEAYVGLGTAAFLHGAWNQIPNIDILTPRAPEHIKVGEREVAGRKAIIRRLDRRLYFGYESQQVDGEWVRVSDKEKTLIDLLTYRYPFADEIILQLREFIDPVKLSNYLKRMGTIRGAKRVRKELAARGLMTATPI